MIKFFRKIRQKLLSENKFSKYIIYAIGEIILVVIGILIALSINNRNELEKNEYITKQALLEIQNDLSRDIIQSQRLLHNYLETYKTSNKIMDFENPFTYQDYRTGKLEDLGNFYYDFVINKNGYENLTNQLERMPEKYKFILNDLRILYVTMNKTIQVSNQRIRNIVYSHLDFINNQNWAVYRTKYGKISEEEMKYYIDSDAYKRYVLSYMNDRYIVFRDSHRFRVKAIETYIKIDSLLNLNSSEQDYDLLGKVKSQNEIEKYLGTYKFTDSTIPSTIKTFYKDNYFYTVDSNNDTIQHYKISDKLFFFMEPSEFGGYPIVYEFIENKERNINLKILSEESPNMIKID